MHTVVFRSLEQPLISLCFASMEPDFPVIFKVLFLWTMAAFSSRFQSNPCTRPFSGKCFCLSRVTDL